jgi:hypothetical protein
MSFFISREKMETEESQMVYSSLVKEAIIEKPTFDSQFNVLSSKSYYLSIFALNIQ